MTFKNEKGLTLIELLITIAVIAIVAAISIPVITNVIDSSRASSAGSMEAQVNAFIDKYADSGEIVYDEETQTFTGFVDLNGDGTFSDPEEIIETFTVDDSQFSVSVDSATAPTSVTVTAGGNSPATIILTGPTNVYYGSLPYGAAVHSLPSASETWSANTPVLYVNQIFSNEYAWVSVSDVRDIFSSYWEVCAMVASTDKLGWAGDINFPRPAGSADFCGETLFIHYGADGKVIPFTSTAP